MLPRLRSFMLLPSLGLVIACAADEASRKPVSTVQVFKSGAPFRGTNGIMFGPQGRLWVASVVTPMLAVLDPESGEVLESYGPEDGIKGPDDVAFGPDGSVYWTDISYGEVGRRAPDGSVTVVGSPGPGVNPITFSDDGRLFVSQCFFGDKLFEIDPLGKEEPRLITDQLGPGCGLNGMDWGSDDFLYGPRWFAREVVKVDVDTGQFETVAADFGGSGGCQVRLAGSAARARFFARGGRAPRRRREDHRRASAGVERGQPRLRRRGPPLRLQLR